MTHEPTPADQVWHDAMDRLVHDAEFRATAELALSIEQRKGRPFASHRVQKLEAIAVAIILTMQERCLTFAEPSPIAGPKCPECNLPMKHYAATGETPFWYCGGEGFDPWRGTPGTHPQVTLDAISRKV